VSIVVLLCFLEANGGGPLELRHAWLSGRDTSKNETVTLRARVVLDDSPELGIPKTAALIRVGFHSVEHPEAVIPLVVLAERKLSERDTHDLFAGVAIGDLDHLGYASCRDNADYVLTLW
jgi:hypothetical protein